MPTNLEVALTIAPQAVSRTAVIMVDATEAVFGVVAEAAVEAVAEVVAEAAAGAATERVKCQEGFISF